MKERLENNLKQVEEAATIKISTLLNSLKVDTQNREPSEVMTATAEKVADSVEPVLEVVATMRKCYGGEDEVTTKRNKETFIKAKKSVIKTQKFVFVGPDDLTVRNPDGTQNVVRELVYGAVPSARVWRPNIYTSEVGLVVNKMNAVVNVMVSHVGATIHDTMGEQHFSEFYDALDTRLGAAKELLTEHRETTPYFYSKSFADALTNLMGDTQTIESTPTPSHQDVDGEGEDA
jgi:hypothetical protein